MLNKAVENLMNFWCDENMKNHTEVMEADKRNSSRDEKTSSAVPEHTKLAEERTSRTSHQDPKPPEGVPSEGEKKILIEEPATKYNIGGTAELGKFRDVVEFCHPLGPEIVRDRRFFVRIEVYINLQLPWWTQARRGRTSVQSSRIGSETGFSKHLMRELLH